MMADHLAGMQLRETQQDEKQSPLDRGFHSGRQMASAVSSFIIFAQKATHRRGGTAGEGAGEEEERHTERREG